MIDRDGKEVRQVPQSRGRLSLKVGRALLSAIAFLGVIVKETSPTRAENASRSATTGLQQCCSTPSYTPGDPRSLILTSKIALTLVSYIVDPALAYQKPSLPFFQQVVRATGADLTINPLASDLTPVGSRLMLTSLPPLRSDLKLEALSDLHKRFADLSDVSFAGGTHGIDGILSEIYEKDRDLIVSFRRRSPDGRVSSAIVFTKAQSDDGVELMLDRGLLQGFGYDVDGQILPDSIFSKDNAAGMTEKDVQTLSALYHR